MKRILIIVAWTIGIMVVLIVILGIGFTYKVKNGFPVSYETEIPAIEFPAEKTAVLLFSKATGYHHTESIEAGKQTFTELTSKNDWFLYSTEEGGVFNPEQLAKFDAVVFNNCTGRLLNEEQQKALENYVTQGGHFIGIHGAGDDSHRWTWYEENLLGANFSHHPIDPQLQEVTVELNTVPDTIVVKNLPESWTHTEEWYVFFENPRAKGFNVVYNIDGNKIISNGNFLFVRDKDFGMGSDHPVAWYREVGKGRTFYTSLGHNSAAWKQEPFQQLLENAVNWK